MARPPRISVAVAVAAVLLAGCAGSSSDNDSTLSSSVSDHQSESSSSLSSDADGTLSGEDRDDDIVTAGGAAFADDIRDLLGSMGLDDDDLADIGKGICQWHRDGFTYSKALDSMAFMGATPSQAETVVASAVSNICPSAWPSTFGSRKSNGEADGRGDGFPNDEADTSADSLSSGSSESNGSSATVSPNATAAPTAAAPKPPKRAAPSPPRPPACPTSANITITAALVDMRAFTDEYDLSGWEYKVRTTVKNTAKVSAVVVTSVEIHGANGMIDSEVDDIDVPAGGSESVVSFEMVSYDEKPVKTVVNREDEGLGSITSLETCAD